MAAEEAAEPSLPPAVLDFCRALPKAELHAHLNGCVRPETIRRLIQERGIPISAAEQEALDFTGLRTLDSCFLLFGVIHRVTTTHEAITQIAREVVQDFSDDGCVYVELRTTPKARPECGGMTKRSYVEAVLAGLEPYLPSPALQSPEREGAEAPARASEQDDVGGRQAPRMLVKLLLSIDRREDAASALETVELAAQFPGRVVGVDLSGHPSIGAWETWRSALERARQLGLAITLHAAEVFAPEETSAMLDFQPERLGHCCKLNAGLERRLIASKIPVELCLTSNLKTSTVPDYDSHHFQQLSEAGCPVVLCTDDSGVFSTTLSREYAIAAHVFQLGPERLCSLVEASFDYLFCSQEEKRQLKETAQQGLSTLCGSSKFLAAAAATSHAR